MGFSKKTWKDRVTEYPTRRILTKPDNTTELVSVERSEGTISEEGDAFSAINMNDFEARIATGFADLAGCTLSTQSDGVYITYTPPGGADPVTKKLGSSTVLIAGFGSNAIGSTAATTATTALVNLRNTYLSNGTIGLNAGSIFECNKDYKSMTVYASTAHTYNHALGFYADGTYDVILNSASASSDVTVDISAYSMIGFLTISEWSGTGFRSATVKFEP